MRPAMTESILKISLSDLATVRICCLAPNCNGVIEVPIDRLTAMGKSSTTCPGCRKLLIAPEKYPREFEPLIMLGRAFGLLELAKDEIRVEFPVTIEEKLK
jgi:hypothetical protein